MAQTGFTPIQLYSTSTAAAAPSASNLTNSTLGSELAINITDGKLFYKDNANAVQVIGWKTVPTTAGGTGLTTYTAGDLSYYATGTTFTKLAIGTAGQILTSTGTAPQWTTLSGVAVTTFSAGTTGFTPNSATSGAVTLAGTLVVSNGGTGLTSLTAGYIPFGNGTSAFNSSANLTFATSTLTVSTASTSVGARTSYTNTASTHEFGILPTSYGGYGVLTAGSAYIYCGNNQALQFAVDNNYIAFGAGSGAPERLRVTAAGDVNVVTGNLVIATSGKGIDFSATPGTGTSELFADYEEGTFTPVVTAAAGSITSYNASGTYVKIGKTVVIQMTFNITNPGTASGLVNFSGLPFTSQNVTDYVYEGRTRENNVSGASSDFLIVANNTTGIILTSTWASNQSYSLAGTYITA
jgi:hypothetical protein